MSGSGARPAYPFTALVGLEALKTALLLAAIDGRLGVLVRGEKGAGKSTAVRGLADLLPAGAPFVDLPVGATEDRLLGGLDLDRALKGEPALKPGLLARAHGGVLYADEVNLLPDHLADALLDAAASGTHIVEREGFSVAQPARFALIGSMNPEEGALRPQLLDRFALCVDVAAPRDPAERRLAIERRLRFDAAPEPFVDLVREEQDRLRAQLERARAGVESVDIAGDLLDLIANAVCEHGSYSLRADLAIVRASRALAALEGAAVVTADHVERVLPLALAHRGGPPSPRTRPAPPPAAAERPDARSSGEPALRSPEEQARRTPPERAPRARPEPRDDNASAEAAASRPGGGDGENKDESTGESLGEVEGDGEGDGEGQALLLPREMRAPRILASTDAGPVGGRGTTTGGSAGDRRGRAADRRAERRGAVIGARRTETPESLDVRTTIAHALARTNTGTDTDTRTSPGPGTAPALPTRGDLHEIVRAPVSSTRFLFVVDASGSQAAKQRMRLVKGAVSALLDSSVRRQDEVAVIAFRGTAASTLLEPTRSADEARLALAYLPTGGRTPLAQGLELAHAYVTARTVLVLLTDGRANVPARTTDAWADALAAASLLTCPTLVIDSETGPQRSGRAAELARAMGATHVSLDGLDAAEVMQLARGRTISPKASYNSC